MDVTKCGTYYSSTSSIKMIIFDPFFAGADELLGGYSRHRTARAKRGVEGTRSEMLKADVDTESGRAEDFLFVDCDRLGLRCFESRKFCFKLDKY